VTRTREYLDTFARGDLDGLCPFFSDDIVWHVAGKHALRGDYTGKDQLIGLLRSRTRPLRVVRSRSSRRPLWPTTSTSSSCSRASGERNGKTLDVEMAEAFTVRSDGTWSEFWAMPDDQDRVDEFWS
jgi:ketosteroid isomerase-like protein